MDYEQGDRQKKLDDIFDFLFDELDILDTEHMDNTKKYEYPVVIKE